MYLNNGIHEASIAQVAETTDTRLRLLTQPTVGVGARSPTEVVPGVSRNFEKKFQQRQQRKQQQQGNKMHF